MFYLRQSTAIRIPIGPFVAASTGNTHYTGYSSSPPNAYLYKAWSSSTAGQSATPFSAAAWSHDVDGMYLMDLSTTHTNTVGPLRVVFGDVSNALAFSEDFMVLSASMYDALFGSSAFSTYAGGDTSGTTTLLSRVGSALTISGGKVASTVGVGDCSDAASIKTTIGTAGVGLTNLGDSRLANLDALVSGRATNLGVWDAQLSALTTATSIGKKLANLAVGTDNGVILYGGTHLGAVIPTVQTTTSVTNDVGITQAGADKAWNTTSRTLTAGTNIVLAKGTGLTGLNDLSSANVTTAVWDAVQSGHTTTGTFGKYLDSAVSGVSTGGLSAATIATAVWQDATSGDFTVTGSIGKQIMTNLDAAVSSRAAAADVWGVATSTLTSSGTIGKKLASWVLGSDSKAVLSSDAHTGAVIPTVTAVTNDVGITQAGADKAWGTTTRVLTAGTNIVLAKGTGLTGLNDLSSSGVANAVWNEVQSGHTTAGTFGKYLDSQISALPATAPTAAQVATAVWQDLVAGSDFATTGSIGKLLTTNVDAQVSSRSSSSALASLVTTVGAAGAGLTAVGDTAGTTTLLSRIGSALTIAGGKVAATVASGDGVDAASVKATVGIAGAGLTNLGDARLANINGSYSLTTLYTQIGANGANLTAVPNSPGTSTLVSQLSGLTLSGGKVPATLNASDVTGNLPADLQTIKTQGVTASAPVTFPAVIGSSSYGGADPAGVTTLLTRLPSALSITSGKVAATVASNDGYDSAANRGLLENLVSGASVLGDSRLGYLDRSIQSVYNQVGFAGAGLTAVTGMLGKVNGTRSLDDVYALIGSGGSNLTALGDSRIANLDAAVSSRLAPGGTLATVSSVANPVTVGTNTDKAGYTLGSFAFPVQLATSQSYYAPVRADTAPSWYSGSAPSWYAVPPSPSTIATAVAGLSPAPSWYSAPPSPSAIAAAVGAASVAPSWYSAPPTPPTPATIATAVWSDATAGDFTTSGTPGKLLMGQVAGALVGTTSVFTSGALANSPLPGALPATDDSGRVTLAPAGLDSIKIEGVYNVRQVIGLLASILGGMVTGMGSNSPVFKSIDPDATSTRASYTTDVSGDRLSFTLHPES